MLIYFSHIDYNVVETFWVCSLFANRHWNVLKVFTFTDPENILNVGTISHSQCSIDWLVSIIMISLGDPFDKKHWNWMINTKTHPQYKTQAT